MYSEQSNGGAQHAAAEPPAGVRTAAGADRHEDRRPPGGAGEKTSSAVYILTASVCVDYDHLVKFFFTVVNFLIKMTTLITIAILSVACLILI